MSTESLSNPQNSGGRILVLIALLCFLPHANAQEEEQHEYFHSGDAFVLPKFPTIPARAWAKADFEIELRIEEGDVKGIKIISSSVVVQNHATKAFDSDFFNSIKNAVRTWYFNRTMSESKRMNVRFRSVICEPEEPKPGYFLLRVEGVDEGLWHDPPTRITIEYHHHLELQSSGIEGKVD